MERVISGEYVIETDYYEEDDGDDMYDYDGEFLDY